MKCFFFILFSMFLWSCGAQFPTKSALQMIRDDNQTSRDDNSQGDEILPNQPAVNLSICSKLDFKNIIWPSFFDEITRNSFAAALNITSSFEGHHSWSAVAGDSDQMGLSLGLVQQNFGSGTLQPLLYKMKSKYPTKMKSMFSSPHYSSFAAMIDHWAMGASPQSTPGAGQTVPVSLEDELFPSDDVVISILDQQKNLQLFPMATAQNEEVLWARKNILTGVNVKADWKLELQNLAATPEYKNIQFKESLKLHIKAENYRDYFGFISLQSYLFLFDIVVQNGGFNKDHLSQYKAYIKTNPSISESKKLNKLLEIRLTTVRPKYVSDVASRKQTILRGLGTVHGQSRDLNKEYCYSSSIAIGPVQGFDSQFLQ